MRHVFWIIVTSLLLTACGGPKPESTAGVAAGAGTPNPAPAAAAPATGSSPAPVPAPGSAAGLDGRTGELVNPDNNAMVFLYYDLAAIPPPIDKWVEEDNRVKYGPAIEKAPNRVAVRAELEAGVAAVRGTGVIRLSLNSANLSDYDPTYGEFTVRALAPSSVVEFDALGQKVVLRFGNGKTAQIWRVPAAEAQGIRDRIAMGNNVNLEVLLAIKSVLPGPAGGTINADVVEYEMRETRGGTLIGRVQVPQS